MFTLLEFSIFFELYDFPQIVRSDAISGQLCEIAPSRNIRWPVRNNSVCFAVYGAMLTNSQVLCKHAEINLYAQVDVKAV